MTADRISVVFRSQLVKRCCGCQMMKSSVGHVFWTVKLKYAVADENSVVVVFIERPFTLLEQTRFPCLWLGN